MSTSDLQMNEISFVPYFLLSNVLTIVVLRTHVEQTVVGNSALVLDLTMLHLHMRNSHGSLVLVCNELAS